MYKTWRAVLTVLVFGFLIVAMIALKAIFFSVPASADIVLKPVIYPDVGEVIELIDDHDLVVFETRDGNQWVFEGIEDWFVGDKIAVAFDDNGTRNDRSDDWIVSVGYFA